MTLVGRILISFVVTLWLSLPTFADVSQAIYKVRASDCVAGDTRALTGFLSRSERGIVTALHGVVGCTTIRVLNDEGQVFRNLQVSRADLESDIALLQSRELAEFVKQNGSIALDFSNETQGRIRVIGYPLDLGQAIETQNIRIEDVKALVRLIPPTDLPGFAICASPALEKHVFSLEGTIRPGESGAPILNESGQVIGIGMGGLDSGRIAIVWASQWSEVNLRSIKELHEELEARAERHCPTNRFSNDSGGCNPLSQNVHIQVNQTSGPRPLLANFSVETDGEYSSFHWEFGDGTTSDRRSPLKTYNTIGVFPVTLTATGPCGETTDNFQMSTIQVPRSGLSVRLGGFSGTFKMDQNGNYTQLQKIKEAFDSWDTGNNNFNYEVVPFTGQTRFTALASGEVNLILGSRANLDTLVISGARVGIELQAWDDILDLGMLGDLSVHTINHQGRTLMIGLPYEDLFFAVPKQTNDSDLEGIGSFLAWLSAM